MIFSLNIYSPGIMSVLTGGQIHSIIFMPGDVPHAQV